MEVEIKDLPTRLIWELALAYVQRGLDYGAAVKQASADLFLEGRARVRVHGSGTHSWQEQAVVTVQFDPQRPTTPSQLEWVKIGDSKIT